MDSAQGIFNDDTFSKMKRGARIINVARGGVIDEPALVRALDAGIVAQARIPFGPLPTPASSVFLQLSGLQYSCHL